MGGHNYTIETQQAEHDMKPQITSTSTEITQFSFNEKQHLLVMTHTGAAITDGADGVALRFVALRSCVQVFDGADSFLGTMIAAKNLMGEDTWAFIPVASRREVFMSSDDLIEAEVELFAELVNSGQLNAGA